MNDSVVLHTLFIALMLADFVHDDYIISLFKTQPRTLIRNFKLIFLTDVDAELIQCLYVILCLSCLYFIFRLFRFIVLVAFSALY